MAQRGQSGGEVERASSESNSSWPAAPDTERAVLGAVLDNRELWAMMVHYLGDDIIDTFWLPDTKVIAATMIEAVEESGGGHPLATTIIDRLSRFGQSDLFPPDPATYLMSLTVQSTIVDGDALKVSLDTLTELAAQRNLIDQATGIATRIREGKLSSEAAASEIRTSVLGVTGSVEPMSIADLEESLKGFAAAWRVPTGLPELDLHFNGGYEPGRLYTIGARPKIGKSTFMMNTLLNAIIDDEETGTPGVPTLFASLEMPQREVFAKLMAIEGLVPWQSVAEELQGKEVLESEEREEMNTARELLGASPLKLMFVQHLHRGMSAIESAATAMRYAIGDGPMVVYLDYIQLMVQNQAFVRNEVSDISRRCKLLALDLDCVVIIASQLTREGDGVMPTARMLRESGSLEQDSDAVIMLNRPALYDPAAASHLIDIRVDLNRSGTTGELQALWHPECQAILPMDSGLAKNIMSASGFGGPVTPPSQVEPVSSPVTAQRAAMTDEALEMDDDEDDSWG